MTVRQFQLLVLTTTVAYGIYLTSPFLGWPPVDAQSEKLLSWSFYGAPAFASHPFVFVALFVARLSVAYGLAAFFTWSRPAFLGWLLVTLVHSALSGLLVIDATWATVGYMLAIADGAILGVAYSKHFEGLWKTDGNETRQLRNRG
jgi:hypothetical protein